MIILIISGVIIGVILAIPISKILIKRHKRKITENATKKILEQKQANLQNSKGKPVDLNFINDGKKMDLKKEVKEALGKTNTKKIKELEKLEKIKIKEIKAKEKEIKKSAKGGEK